MHQSGWLPSAARGGAADGLSTERVAACMSSAGAW